jgi:hypothetical protein
MRISQNLDQVQHNQNKKEFIEIILKSFVWLWLTLLLPTILAFSNNINILFLIRSHGKHATSVPRSCQDGKKEFQWYGYSINHLHHISQRNRPASIIELQSSKMRVSTSLIIFNLYISFSRAAAFQSNLIRRDVVFCDGPQGPKSGNGCNIDATKPCCTDSDTLERHVAIYRSA